MNRHGKILRNCIARLGLAALISVGIAFAVSKPTPARACSCDVPWDSDNAPYFPDGVLPVNAEPTMHINVLRDIEKIECSASSVDDGQDIKLDVIIMAPGEWFGGFAARLVPESPWKANTTYLVSCSEHYPDRVVENERIDDFELTIGDERTGLEDQLQNAEPSLQMHECCGDELGRMQFDFDGLGEEFWSRGGYVAVDYGNGLEFIRTSQADFPGVASSVSAAASTMTEVELTAYWHGGRLGETLVVDVTGVTWDLPGCSISSRQLDGVIVWAFFMLAGAGLFRHRARVRGSSSPNPAPRC